VEFKGSAGGRMGETQSGCMQKISIGRPEFFRKLFQGFFAVNVIANHRMAN
jgi:hypothetical protein